MQILHVKIIVIIMRFIHYNLNFFLINMNADKKMFNLSTAINKFTSGVDLT